MKKKNSF